MKAGIVICLGEMVKERYGRDKWEAVLEESGFARTSLFMPIQDVDDSTVITILESTCKVLGLSMEQATAVFGDYWVNVYAPKIYSTYFRGMNSAKDFLLRMDRVHEAVTNNIPNARPPRFSYEWKDDRTLLMNYSSSRGLLPLLMGCAKGVGKYFNERVQVTPLGMDVVEIVFG